MLRPISWCACFSTFLAYFSFPFSFLVVAAASVEDSICVPLPGSLPPPGDEIIVGVRPSVCGYGKDSAFAFRDFGARIFTGGGGEDCASALRGSGALCCLPNVTPSDVQLQHHRFGPRAIEFSFIGKTCHFDEKLAKFFKSAMVRRSPGRLCAGSASDKNPTLRAQLKWLCRVSVGLKIHAESSSNGSSRPASHITGALCVR